MNHHLVATALLAGIVFSTTGQAAVRHVGTCLDTGPDRSRVPDATDAAAHTPLCLSPNRRSVDGAVSVPLEVDLHTVSDRLCDTAEWSDLVWFVESAHSPDPSSKLTDVTLTAGGRTTDLSVEVECAPNTLQVRVYRSTDSPVAELRWMPVQTGERQRLEGHLHIESPIPLPASIRRLVAQRLLVGPTRALASIDPTTSLSSFDPPHLENP